MEYFIQSTKTERRGRQAGSLLLLSVLALFLLRIAVTGIELSAIILIIWRLLGLSGAFRAQSLMKPKDKSMEVSYRSIFGQRSFILYFLPWIMFSLVNYLTTPTQISVVGQSMFTELQLISTIVGPLSSIPAGFLLDYVGRKQAAVAGFVLLGVSYSFLGLYPYEMASWFLFAIFNGVTWGILSVLFVVCIWGELNPNSPSDKYYAIGVIPFFISESLSLVFTNYLSYNISTYAIFSLSAFFLFIAVLPLIYAPETLPEKIKNDRDLKSYVEKAMKKVQSESEKSQKRTSEKPDQADVEFQVNLEENNEEYEKAKQLAEKYY
jgi:Sec-independent protein translocase protein TatA